MPDPALHELKPAIRARLPSVTASLCFMIAANLTAGCDPDVGRRDGGARVDARAAPGPPELTLEPPSVLSWPLATVRGTAPLATRVLVRGAGNPFFASLLPDESFCVDVPLPAPGPVELEILAQSESGFSEPTLTSTEFDPTAPEGPVIPTCAGADPRGCGALEICDNLIDDDCDSRIDDEDSDCDPCPDDLLEPNDSPDDAPLIPPDTYDALVLCPDDDDHYVVFLREGERVDVTLRFAHEDANLDLELFDPEGTEVAAARSTTDDERLSFDATQLGEHRFRVYSAERGATSSYRLSLSVSP